MARCRLSIHCATVFWRPPSVAPPRWSWVAWPGMGSRGSSTAGDHGATTTSRSGLFPSAAATGCGHPRFHGHVQVSSTCWTRSPGWRSPTPGSISRSLSGSCGTSSPHCRARLEESSLVEGRELADDVLAYRASALSTGSRRHRDPAFHLFLERVLLRVAPRLREGEDDAGDHCRDGHRHRIRWWLMSALAVVSMVPTVLVGSAPRSANRARVDRRGHQIGMSEGRGSRSAPSDSSRCGKINQREYAASRHDEWSTTEDIQAAFARAELVAIAPTDSISVAGPVPGNI